MACYKCKDCGYFIDLPPDAGVCSKPMGGRNGDVWGNDDICEDFELDKMTQEELNKTMSELEEKIALVKKNGSWDGVDVDKFMDEIRGRD